MPTNHDETLYERYKREELELARVRREHMQAMDYADMERRVLANDAAYVAAWERAYPHLKGED